MYRPVRGARKDGRARAALRKRRLGSRWYVVLYSGTRIVARFARLCQIVCCSGLLPLLPPARHSLGRPAACPPGRRGRRARRAPGALCPTGDAWANVANVIPGLGGQLTRLLPPPRPRPRRADRPPRAPGAARSERAGCTALCPTGGDATPEQRPSPTSGSGLCTSRAPCVR